MLSKRSKSLHSSPNAASRIVDQISTFTSASVLSQLIALSAAILSRRFLGPTSIGMWAVLQIVLTYSSYSALGVMKAATREIPYNRGKGDEQKATDIKNIVFSFSVVASCVMAGIVFFVAVFFKNIFSEKMFYGLLITSGLIVLQRINNLLIVLIRAYKHFSLAGKQMIISSVVNAILIATMSYWFKIYGFMMAMVLSFGFNIMYLWIHQKFDLNWKLNLSETLPLIQSGMPLLLLTFMGTVFLSIDKIMVAKWLGLESLGLYGIAVLTCNYLMTFQNSIGIVLMPNFQERFGKSDDPIELKELLSKALNCVTVFIPILIITTWILIPHAVYLVLPDFSSSIMAIRILLISVFFLAAEHVYMIFVIAIKKNLSMLPFLFAVCFLAVFFNWLVLWLGWGIEGVALATTIVFLSKFLCTRYLTYRYLNSLSRYWIDFVPLVGRFALLGFALFTIHTISINIQNILIEIIVSFAVLFGFYIRGIIRLNHEYDLYKRIVNKFGGSACAA